MIKILYDDKYIICCEKPSGILSEPSPTETECVSVLLEQQLDCSSLSVINRLDRNVSGVMLLAKRRDSAGKFSALVAERKINKEYLAIVHGVPEHPCGVYSDLLFKDSLSNKTYVVDKMRKGVKDASLEYRVISVADSEDGTLCLVRIKLHTGRTHQIRAQFSHRHTPLFGDGKYGSHTNRGRIALHSARMEFSHPFIKKNIDSRSLPCKEYPWNLFEDCISEALFDKPILVDAPYEDQ